MEPTQNNTSVPTDGIPSQPGQLTPPAQPEGVISVPVAAGNAAVPMENAPVAPPPLPAAAQPVDPAAQTQAPAQPTSNLLNTPMPSAADDTDLIEREWVDKAKAIVEHTRADPHLQNQEINKMKADYIQKRYNRQIKIDEG